MRLILIHYSTRASRPVLSSDFLNRFLSLMLHAIIFLIRGYSLGRVEILHRIGSFEVVVGVTVAGGASFFSVFVDFVAHFGRVDVEVLTGFFLSWTSGVLALYLLSFCAIDDLCDLVE